MMEQKNCTPSGAGALCLPNTKKRPKKAERKCSTCSNKKCGIRGAVCDWVHCGEWMGQDG